MALSMSTRVVLRHRYDARTALYIVSCIKDKMFLVLSISKGSYTLTPTKTNNLLHCKPYRDLDEEISSDPSDQLLYSNQCTVAMR